jgi:hydrogenase nickel incorporation protein HypB
MTERVAVVEKILSANDRLAEENRRRLDEQHVFGVNIMASPGAGKTSLIERTLAALGRRWRVGVVDGDVATSIDADRAAAAGASAVQVNTGGECHLDAVMLHGALEEMDLKALDLLIGPAGFQLGTHKSVLVASVPEGDDKPYKYPGMYRGVQALVINKIDLQPYVEFDMDYFRSGVEILNPGLETFPLSCKTGDGLKDWVAWLEGQLAHRQSVA